MKCIARSDQPRERCSGQFSPFFIPETAAELGPTTRTTHHQDCERPRAPGRSHRNGGGWHDSSASPPPGLSEVGKLHLPGAHRRRCASHCATQPATTAPRTRSYQVGSRNIPNNHRRQSRQRPLRLDAHVPEGKKENPSTSERSTLTPTTHKIRIQTPHRIMLVNSCGESQGKLYNWHKEYLGWRQYTSKSLVPCISDRGAQKVYTLLDNTRRTR